jgi:hypothetical protein
MWLQSNHINVAVKSYTRFTGYLKNCQVCSLRSQCMRKRSAVTGRQVLFVNDSSTNVISYTDKNRQQRRSMTIQ